MDILRHLYLNSACRAPDEPVADPVVVEPVVEPVIEPVADPVVEPDPAPRPDPAPAAPHGNRGQTPWFQRVIAEVREDKRQQASRADAAERRAADLQAIIERMQADPAAPAPKPAAQPAPQDFQAAVKAQATKDRLYEDTMTVRTAGEAEFSDFGETLGILNAIGVTNDDFVADLLAVDKAGAHKILDKLAKEPEKAASLVGMDSRRRIAELTRMADAPKIEPKPEVAPKPAPISRAPAPKPQVSPLAAAPEVDPTSAEGNEKMSDAEWERWYKSKYVKRA